MKKSKIFGIIILTGIIGIFLFPLNQRDSDTLSTADVACGREAAFLMFENIFERALMRGIVVTHKEADIVYASSYTFAGIPMSQVAANCKNGSARRL